MAPKAPKLKESQIASLATDQSFERGQRYFRDGAITNPVRQGNTLWADCQGTDLYYPRVTLGPQGVESSSCTCPYDWGGICKHQVALLLTYIHEPNRFQELQPLPQLLAKCSREDLLHMIEQMVQIHPDLISVVDAPLTPTAGQVLDLAHYQRQVERLFQGNEMHSMAAGLEALADHGQRLSQTGDWLHAGDVYHLLLAAANHHYDYSIQEIDYDGEVGCAIQDIAEGLSNCLEQAGNLDAERHRQWLDTCFNAVLKDLELGGVDYGYPASDAIVCHTTEADWAWLEQRVRAAIQLGKGRAVSDWGRSRLVRLLTEWANHWGKPKLAAALLLELGTPQQQAFFYLDNGALEAAISIARTHFKSLPGLVTQFADALLAAKAPDLALEFVQDCAQGGRYSYGEWLTKFYRDHGQPEQFITAQFDWLRTQFSLQGYQALQAQAEPLGQWKALRKQLLSSLEAGNRYPSLIDVALYEQDWGAALCYLKKLTLWDKEPYQERVAKQIETAQPEAAIALYQDLVQAAIDRRGRANYSRAAGFLKILERIYGEMQQATVFQQYLQRLKAQHKNLPALKQELARTGL